MLEYTFPITETLAISVILLIIGRWIKSKVVFLQKYFIPAPVIGGIIFAIITLIGHNTNTFSFSFDTSLQNLLMVAFFTTIGFQASFKMLAKGGLQVLIFLVVATILVIFQDAIGVILAKILGINPLIGIAAGSVPLSGGHGTSAAFGPVLEENGAVGATAVAVASATYGLIAGSLIGGPIGKIIMEKYKLVGNPKESVMYSTESKMDSDEKNISEESLFDAVVMITVSMGVGIIINMLFKKINFTLPAYIGPMFAAAIIRNVADNVFPNKKMPMNELFIVGNIALSIFLSMALMTLKLWELAALALPLVIILLSQTLFIAIYVYFVTFRAMGKTYDAAVMVTGHCGFGLGASPNAIANMESFTTANGPSPQAFFVVPLVAALFIDFTNAVVITFFIDIVNKFLA